MVPGTRALVIAGKALYATAGALTLVGGAYCALAEGWDVLTGFGLILLGGIALVVGATLHGLGLALSAPPGAGPWRTSLLVGAALTWLAILLTLVGMAGVLSTFPPVLFLVLLVPGLILLLYGALARPR